MPRQGRVLVEVVDDRAHLVVQQVNHPVVQAAQHPRARRVERHALDAVRLELELGQHGAQNGGGGKVMLVCILRLCVDLTPSRVSFSGRKRNGPKLSEGFGERPQIRLAAEELGFAVDWSTPSSWGRKLKQENARGARASRWPSRLGRRPFARSAHNST